MKKFDAESTGMTENAIGKQRRRLKTVYKLHVPSCIFLFVHFNAVHLF